MMQVSSKAKKADLIAALEDADAGASLPTNTFDAAADADAHSPQAPPVGSKRGCWGDDAAPALVKKERGDQQLLDTEVKAEVTQHADVNASATQLQSAMVKAEAPAVAVKHEELVEDPWDSNTQVIPPVLPSDTNYYLISTQELQRSAAQLTCPYMDSINRHILDFDFEKLCSVSNVKLNV